MPVVFLNSVVIFLLCFIILVLKVFCLFFVLHVDVCYLFLLFFSGFDWNVLVLIVLLVCTVCVLCLDVLVLVMLMFVFCSCYWFLNLVLVLE